MIMNDPRYISDQEMELHSLRGAEFDLDIIKKFDFLFTGVNRSK
jgi:hypothetical protein